MVIHHIRDRSQLVATGWIAAATLLFALAAPCSRAALWQSDHWALTGATEAGVGYDSNLFARKGGDDDGYLLIAPTFTIQRLNSFTSLHIDFNLKAYTFFTRSDLNSLDPSLTLELRYPYDDYVYPTQQVDLNASRSTEVNGDVGGRLRRQDFRGRWEGNILATEKTVFQGRVEGHQTDYLTTGYNNNEFATAGLTLAHILNERLQLGGGYDYEYSRSQPKDSLVPETSFSQHLLSLRGRGEFLPKVTGYFFVGGASTTNRGGTHEKTSFDLQGELQVVWQATERTGWSLRASRRTYFSPDGYAYTPTTFGPELTQQLSGGYSVVLGADVERLQYRYRLPRTDKIYGGHFALRYSLNERYTANLTLQYTNQSSPEPVANYDRSTIYGNVVYKF